MTAEQMEFRPDDWGEDWGFEETHAHCVETEKLCKGLARGVHGHGPQCCTCDETVPEWMRFGYRHPIEWAKRLQSRDDERILEASGVAPEVVEEIVSSTIKSLMRDGVPVPREALEDDGKWPGRRSAGRVQLSGPTRTVYEEMAIRAAETPRVITTTNLGKGGRVVRAHNYIGDVEGSCKRCGLPRTNRLHIAGDVPVDPVYKALREAVEHHQCDAVCYDQNCTAVAKVQRILKGIS